MNLNALEKNPSPLADKQFSPPPSPEGLRRVAEQFEAILLMQLTSALNGSEDEGEDSLFGSDGGSGLAKKMFSEQMANAMADAGGVGLADLIMQKFQANQSAGNKLNPLSNDKQLNPLSNDNSLNPLSNYDKLNPLSKTISAVKEIRTTESPTDDSPSKTISETASPVNAPTIFIPTSENLSAQRDRIIADKPVTYSQDISAPIEVYSPNLVRVSSPTSSASVNFQMPALGRVSSTFGSRFHPIDKKVKFHGGIDVAIPTGTRVNSAADGVISFAGKKGGYGNVVIIQHPDGRETRYAHLDKVLVSVGDSVSGGQEVAKSGSTGKSTGPHLHFEVRENGQVVNPLKILSNVLPKRTDR